VWFPFIIRQKFDKFDELRVSLHFLVCQSQGLILGVPSKWRPLSYLEFLLKWGSSFTYLGIIPKWRHL